MKKIVHNIQCKAHLRVQVGPFQGPPGALEWRNAGLQMGQNWSLGAPKQVMLAPLGLDETNTVPKMGPRGIQDKFRGSQGHPMGHLEALKGTPWGA